MSDCSHYQCVHLGRLESPVLKKELQEQKKGKKFVQRASFGLAQESGYSAAKWFVYLKAELIWSI